MRPPRWVVYAVWAINSLVIAAAVVAGVVLAGAGRWDFNWFYDDALLLVSGTDMTQSHNLEWYLPGMRIVIMPLGLLSGNIAGMVWNVVNLAALAATVLGLFRLARYGGSVGTPGRTSPRHEPAVPGGIRAASASDAESPFRGAIRIGASCRTLFPAIAPGTRAGHEPAVPAVGLAMLLALPVTFCVFQMNQVSYWPIALVIWAGVADLAGRRYTSGVLLGAAIFVKIVPALLVGYYLLRKRYASAALAIVTAIVLTTTIDTAVSGPAAMVRHHMHWYDISVQGSSGAAFLDDDSEMTHQNQGLAVVLGRLLHQAPAKTTHPLPWMEKRPVEQFQIAHLNAGTVRIIYYVIVAGTLLALSAVTWYYSRRTGTPQSHYALFGMWCVAMMWFAPLMRQYYLVWALPALLVLVHQALLRTGGKLQRVTRVAGVVVWCMGLIGWALPEARAVGANQLVNLLLMGTMVAECVGQTPGRTAAAVRQPT